MDLRQQGTTGIDSTITQSLMSETSGILALNRKPYSHCCPGCAEKAQNSFFEICTKSNHSRKLSSENYRGMHLVYTQSKLVINELFFPVTIIHQ